MSHTHDRCLRHLSLTLSMLVLAGTANGADEQSPAAAAREARVQRQLAADPQALPKLADTVAGLPNFDIRTGENGAAAGFVARSLADFAQTPSGVKRAEAAAALRASLPELAIDDDLFFGTPRFVRSTRVFLTPPIGKDQKQVDDLLLSARYVADHSALFEIDPLEIAAARVSRDFVTPHNGAHHLTFQQQVQGRDIFGCEVRANFTRNHELINISSTMLPRPEGGFAIAAPKLTAVEAVIAAAANVGITIGARPEAESTDATPESLKTTWKRAAELRADEPLVTDPIYFPLTRDDIRPAFSVVIAAPGVGNTYDIVVDATTGAILWRANRLVWDTTQPAQYRVFTGDSPAPLVPGRATPDGFQALIVDRELVTIAPASISPFSPNGWVADGGLETFGNNVDAHTDLDTNNLVSAGDLPRPTATLDGGTNTRIFDFPCDTTLAPSTYRNAAVTQLFYLSNLYHDKLYSMGFDEAAGNFQTVNFSGQGVGGDAVQADAQDGNGAGTNANNANFSTTGADGSGGRMQMYLFTGPTPDRDGDLDAFIVYHELTHGTSIRLHGGLNTNQSGGMGEGWSDYFALSLLTRPTDDPNVPYAMGGYSTFQFLPWPVFTNNYYSGIRRYPYSTSFSVNPMTFKFIDVPQIAYPAGVPRNASIADRLTNNGVTTAEVHGIGEVWCNILWQCRASLWAAEGPSANQTMLQLVVDGMKLSAANPTFVQSRDAIIQADMVNNAAAHRIPLWSGFAQRGLGAQAFAPPSTGTVGVIESYLPPFRANFSFPDGLPTRLSPGVSTSLRVAITPDEVTIVPGTAMLHVEGVGVTPATIPLTQNPAGDYAAVIPPQNCFTGVRLWFSVDTSRGVSNEPPAGASAAYSVPVYTAATNIFSDSFETDTGWVVGTSTATSGLWTRADPNGTTAQPEDDHTSGAGVNCWLTGQGTAGNTNAGAADVDGGSTILISPSFDLSGQIDARFSYWRWYSNGLGGAPFADTFRVDVSTNNGVAWVNAETVGPADSADTRPGWRFASWTLAGLGLTPTATVRVRFIAEDAGTGSLIEAAVDDFAIDVFGCTPPTTCAADFNHDGAATVQDIFDFLAAFFSNATSADVNHADGVTVQDVFDYLSMYFTGC